MRWWRRRRLSSAFAAVIPLALAHGCPLLSSPSRFLLSRAAGNPPPYYATCILLQLPLPPLLSATSSSSSSSTSGVNGLRHFRYAYTYVVGAHTRCCCCCRFRAISTRLLLVEERAKLIVSPPVVFSLSHFASFPYVPFPSSGILLWCIQMLGQAVVGFGCGAGVLSLSSTFARARVCVCRSPVACANERCACVSPGNKPEECAGMRTCVSSYFSPLPFNRRFVSASRWPLYEFLHYLYSAVNFSARCTPSAPDFRPVSAAVPKLAHAYTVAITTNITPTSPTVCPVVPSISFPFSFSNFHFYWHVFGSCCRKPSETPRTVLHAGAFLRQ
nr:uncharacterized protein LOC129384346 isoform X1 [Dermacentor andersoni]